MIVPTQYTHNTSTISFKELMYILNNAKTYELYRYINKINEICFIYTAKGEEFNMYY